MSKRVLVDGSVSRRKGILVEEMEILPQKEMMSGLPERAGKDTTRELVVLQIQEQFFEAGRVRVQHRSGKPMDEAPEIMETALLAGSTSSGPQCGDGDAGEVVQEDEISERRI